MSAELIVAKNLKKNFGSTRAVNNVSFSIKKGELVGFMGPNGAGKSTTMRLLSGYLKPDAGKISINGVDMVADPVNGQAFVGYLPEQGGIYGDLTVGEYLDFLANAYGTKDKKKSLKVVTQLTRCDGFLTRPMSMLSKGMRQRVFLAGALIHNPPVLILDEPTDGLDPNQKHEMRLMLEKLAKTKAVIVSTHILEEAEAICTRVIVVANGKVVADETPAKLKKRKGDINKSFRDLTVPSTPKGRKNA